MATREVSTGDFSQGVVVKARVDGKTAYYDLFAGETKIRTTRYSELEALQKKIGREAPRFKGRLSGKTFRRYLDDAFIEARRDSIQNYFTQATTDQNVLATEAFKAFFKDWPDQIQGPREGDAAEEDDDGNESELPDEPEEPATPVAPLEPAVPVDNAQPSFLNESFDVGVKEDLTRVIGQKRSQLEQAIKAKEEVENTVASGEAAAEQAAADAVTVAAAEKQARERLTAYCGEVENLQASILAKRATLLEKETANSSSVTRLTQEVAAATLAVKEARARNEAALRARAEAAAAAKARIEACERAIIDAAASFAGAQVHRAAVESAMQVMGERVAAKESEAKLTEVERVETSSAVTVLEEESAKAEQARRKADAELAAASAELAAHEEDVARRARAHSFEVRRADQRMVWATALRDTGSRGAIEAELDLKALEGNRRDIERAAEAALRAKEVASERLEASKKADAETTATLTERVERATSIAKQRETILASVNDRLEASKAQRNSALSKHCCASAGHQACRDDYDRLKAQVEGPLKARVEETAAENKRAEEALAAARRESEEALRQQSHKESAEARSLKRQQETEARLVQALDEARISAAEADGERRTSREGAESDGQDARELGLLIASSRAQLEDRKRAAQEAEAAQAQTEAELEGAQAELETCRQAIVQKKKSSDDVLEASASFGAFNVSLMGTDVEDPEHATIEVRVLDLEQAVETRRAACDAAVAAVATAADAVAQLEAQQREAPPAIGTLDALIQAELAILRGRIAAREKGEKDAFDENQRKQSAWAEEKKALSVSMHSKSVQVRVAQENIESVERVWNRCQTKD